MQEFELVSVLGTRLAPRRTDTRLGIGDDAALLAPPAGHELVVTTDTLIAGRHFPDTTAPEAVGYKSIAVNLSDLAAMGATPAWLTVSLAAPALSKPWCNALLDGMEAALAACTWAAPIDIVGGDTTRADRLTLSITAIGQVAAGQAVRRSGARVGDVIAVTGTLGDAAAGLACYQATDLSHTQTDAQRSTLANDRSADRQWLIQRLERPDLRRGAALVGMAHAAIDVSDGLLADLGHILAASGVGAQVALDTLPTSDALRRVVADPEQRLRYQTSGGDDYELCLTTSPAAVPILRQALGCPLTVIGKVSAAAGLVLLDAKGRAVEPTSFGSAGWDHFRT